MQARKHHRSETKPERSSLLRYLATDCIWWGTYLIFSYVVGWSIASQLKSPWFWIVALAIEAISFRSWLTKTPQQRAKRAESLHQGHHAYLPRRQTIRQALVGYVIIAFIALGATTLFVDTEIAENRTSVLSEEAAFGTYDWWGESLMALNAELWGLAVYDYALLIGMVIIGLELISILLRRAKPGQTTRKLWILDSLASLSTQIPFYFIEIFTVTAMVGAYFFIWDNLTLFTLPQNYWIFILAIIAADLAYYWEHRAAHEIRLLWTGHAVHHSSPIFNTAVAFRFGPFEPLVAVFFHLPLILMGFHPAFVIAAEIIVQAYQFWLHTELVPKLGPLEQILNTPSNHRVHHGSDSEYLDKNYGGILIIFDRMFGTYQPEISIPNYGLTTPINTTNPLKVWTSEFPSLFADLRSATNWRDWVSYLTHGPGWRPKNDSNNK